VGSVNSSSGGGGASNSASHSGSGSGGSGDSSSSRVVHGHLVRPPFFTPHLPLPLLPPPSY